MPLSGEKAFSAGGWGGVTLCFLEWELTTKESFVLNNSLCYSCNYAFSQKPVAKWIGSQEKGTISPG